MRDRETVFIIYGLGGVIALVAGVVIGGIAWGLWHAFTSAL
jgi:hypothetical protein